MTRIKQALLTTYKVRQTKIMGLLDQQMAMDKELWDTWLRSGVTEETVLPVDFFFYASTEDDAESVAGRLKGLGMEKIEISSTRRLLFRKKWLVTGVATRTWSLDELKQYTMRCLLIAHDHSSCFDGCGAMLPESLPLNKPADENDE